MRSQECLALESAYRSAQSNADYYFGALAGAMAAGDGDAVREITGYLNEELSVLEAVDGAMHTLNCYP